MAENPRTIPGINVALSIAGSDSCGGAGIQADLKTFTVMGVYGASAVTAITAQNTKGVTDKLELDPKLIDKQIDAVAGDFQVRGTKTGMLANAATVNTVASAISRNSLFPLVIDPVMITKSGVTLIADEAIAAMKKKLFPLAALVTPNRHEAARLVGRDGELTEIADGLDVAKQICTRMGVRACLITGFRKPGDSEDEAVDIYHDGTDTAEIAGAWRLTTNTHGSGCTYSAAIAAGLANGLELMDAIHAAKNLMNEVLRQNIDIGAGAGPINHVAYLKVKK